MKKIILLCISLISSTFKSYGMEENSNDERPQKENLSHQYPQQFLQEQASFNELLDKVKQSSRTLEYTVTAKKEDGDIEHSVTVYDQSMGAIEIKPSKIPNSFTVIAKEAGLVLTVERLEPLVYKKSAIILTQPYKTGYRILEYLDGNMTQKFMWLFSIDPDLNLNRAIAYSVDNYQQAYKQYLKTEKIKRLMIIQRQNMKNKVQNMQINGELSRSSNKNHKRDFLNVLWELFKI